jgi:hypothetical protein
MLITVVFILYALLFTFLYNYTQNWGLRKKIAEPRPPRPLSFVTNVLAIFGIPWFILLSAGTYWGFTVPPDYGLRLSQDTNLAMWLLIAVLLALALSYTVVFQTGSMAGYREGRHQALAHFPHFVREGVDGKPFEIRGYVRHDQQIARGSELHYEGCLFVVASVQDYEDCCFVVARHPSKADGDAET